jgi:hypothetical protein
VNEITVLRLVLCILQSGPCACISLHMQPASRLVRCQAATYCSANASLSCTKCASQYPANSSSASVSLTALLSCTAMIVCSFQVALRQAPSRRCMESSAAARHSCATHCVSHAR